MKIPEEIFDRPIAYHRIFTKIGGSVTAGVMLSQAYYWSQRTKSIEGWFYKTVDEWEEETGLTRSEQETARKHLIEKGIISYKVKGIPATGHYLVNHKRVIELITGQFAENLQTSLPNQFAENLQTGLQEKRKLDVVNPENLNIESETTTENTTYIGKENYEIQVENLEEIPQSYRELSNTFTRSTGILLYRNQEWDQAITDMLANGVDPGLLDQAIQKLRGARMTISGPWSVAKTAIGLKTEQSVNSFEVANG